MTTRIRLPLVRLLCLAAMWLSCDIVVAQQAAPQTKKTTNAPARPAAGQPTTAVDDAARKSEILSSQRWRRAMFEMNEWLSSQRIYSPEEVAKIKASFSAKVAGMSADQMEYMLDDIDAKFKVLETPQAQEARAWLAQYLSILSVKKREEVLSKLPNIETMTAAQLQATIGAIDERRLATQRQNVQVQQLRESATNNPWTQNTKLAEAAYVRDHSTQRSAYSSPYRAPSVGKRPFEDVKTGPGMGFYVNPYGGVGLMFGGGF